VRDEIANRYWRLTNALPHQGAESESPSMVAHPAGLKCGFLPVVSEHEQTFALGMAQHFLSEYVDVGDGNRAHRPCRFAIRAAKGTPRRAAREAALQDARLVLVLSDGSHQNQRCRAATRIASKTGLGMDGPTQPAEPHGRRARNITIIVFAAKQAVEQNDSIATIRLILHFPNAAIVRERLAAF
jgi:hypothetical protein